MIIEVVPEVKVIPLHPWINRLGCGSYIPSVDFVNRYCVLFNNDLSGVVHKVNSISIK